MCVHARIWPGVKLFFLFSTLWNWNLWPAISLRSKIQSLLCFSLKYIFSALWQSHSKASRVHTFFYFCLLQHRRTFITPSQLKRLTFVFIHAFYQSRSACSTAHIEQLLSREPFANMVSDCALLKFTHPLGILQILNHVQLQQNLCALININPCS